MQLKDLIRYGEDTLCQAGIEEYSSDARILAMYVMKLDYTGIFMNLPCEISEEKEIKYKELIDIRKTHYPCQYIVGTQDFMGYTFKVKKEVLIPRPETEILVETALCETAEKSSLRALDMCCGSGCIGISYSLKRQEGGYSDDRVLLADISDNAISLANENKFELEAKCDIIKSDLFENIEGEFDLIMSNPPYIPSADIEELMRDVREFEPRLALDGRSDGLYFYREIIQKAKSFLKQESVMIFEIGYDQYEDIRALLLEAGFEDVHIKQDYAGLDRVVTARRN